MDPFSGLSDLVVHALTAGFGAAGAALVAFVLFLLVAAWATLRGY